MHVVNVTVILLLQFGPWVLLSLLIHGPFLVSADLPCPLEWESSGFGHYPHHDQAKPIFVNEEKRQIVGRVNLDGVWVAGAVDLESGKLNTVVQFDVGATTQLFIRKYDFYQVLTNPHNCIVQWVTTHAKEQTPPHAYQVDTRGQELIGRTRLEGYIVGGRVTNQQLLISFEGAVRIPEGQFEILVSIYPKLNMLITGLRYPTLDLVEIRAATITELVDGELILNTLNDVSLTTTISHARTTKERLLLSEDAQFEEIGSISSRDVRLWFGGPYLELESYTIDGGPRSAVTVNRTRHVSATRTITVSGRSDVQICTTMDVLDGFPIDFSATAEFSLPNMTANHVEHVLIEVGGRPIVPGGVGNVVLATITGKLSGRYVTSTAMQNSAPDKLGPCVSFL